MNIMDFMPVARKVTGHAQYKNLHLKLAKKKEMSNKVHCTNYVTRPSA